MQKPTYSKALNNAENAKLPIVGSAKNFEHILKEMNKKQQYFEAHLVDKSEESAFKNGDREALEYGTDFSSTNVQVEGVDEADRVKNDSSYIYQLREEQLIISKVNPIRDLQVVYTEKFDYNDFYPQEMYLDDRYLVLIGGRPANDKNGSYHKEYTKIKIYQLNNRRDLKLIREVEMEGYYLSSRKIKQALYVVTNKHLPYYLLDNARHNKERQKIIKDMKPTYRDTVIAKELQVINWDKMYYFPESTENNYLLVSGLDLADIQKPVTVNSYLGAGQTIYATNQHLYVTKAHYEFANSPMENSTTFIRQPVTNQETIIYKFKLANGLPTFLAEGKVEGSILNQFSMDEYNGHFRIATTKGDTWSDNNRSENLLFILDKNLKVVSSLTGIAKGERIYSVRFMGDRGYIVTFKQVDPLFVVDLKDPKKPGILGALKIPGFSEYLHPYDENHLIGFGKDTIDNNTGGAVVQGFKMALFDITDVNNPKEKFVEIIGDRGTHSELLYNHKALLFSKAKNIIGFPIEVYENNNKSSFEPTLAFQGAYIYRLDLVNGFQLKKKISHYDPKEIADNYYNWDYHKQISRLLYIKDHLYTVSNYKIEVHDLNSFVKKAELLLSNTKKNNPGKIFKKRK